MPSISLAEAVVQQTAIIEEARLQMDRTEDPGVRRVWSDVMLKALAKIDELCLKRMEQTTYEMLRRQQKALLAGLSFPAQSRG